MTIFWSLVSILRGVNRIPFVAHLFAGAFWIFFSAVSLLGIEVASPCSSFRIGSDAPPASYLQPASSGRLQSAMFGMVRNDGTRFHEGVDFRSVLKTSDGDSLDIVRASLPGEVAHVCRENNGSYGRYVVLLHRSSGIQLYTLYAHLAVVADSLREGDQISAGTIIGIMGRTSTAFRISRASAHLHFEVGLVLGKAGFNSWYKRLYGGGNLHGIFNGFNLVGGDPLSFFASDVASSDDFYAWVKSQPRAFSVVVPSRGVPDILASSPALLGQNFLGEHSAWLVDFTWFGMPIAFKRVGGETDSQEPYVASIDRKFFREASLRGMLSGSEDSPLIGKSLRNYLSIIFNKNCN